VSESAAGVSTGQQVVAMTDAERQMLQRLLGNPLELPPVFKGWLKAWLNYDGPGALDTPIRSIQAQTQGRTASDPGSYPVGSFSYIAPSQAVIADLAPGTYQFSVKCTVQTSADPVANYNAYLNVAVNGGGETAADEYKYPKPIELIDGPVRMSTWSVRTLTGSSNWVAPSVHVDRGSSSPVPTFSSFTIVATQLFS